MELNQLLLKVFLVFLLMIVTHELGHFLMLLICKVKLKDMKLRILGIEYKANLSNIDKTAVLAAGVIAGVIPIILLLDYSYILLLVLAMYIYGCAKDIKKIWQLDKIIKSNYLGDK